MGVSEGHLRALPEGRTKGQEGDRGRILREHRLPLQVSHSLAGRSAAREAVEAALALCLWANRTRNNEALGDPRSQGVAQRGV